MDALSSDVPRAELQMQDTKAPASIQVATDGEWEQDLELAEHDEHVHYSHRAPWLRAFILGANDGLVSTASLMLGVAGGSEELSTMRLAGLSAWIAGALSMAVGEYISVAGQRDAEEADVEKERAEQAKGPAARLHELQELAQIYVNRSVAEELTAKDVIRAHARDELGIDLDDMANPLQAAVVSSLAFTAGALMPLLGGAFIPEWQLRLMSVIVVSSFGLVLFGFLGASLGGARVLVGGCRVLLGGWMAMAITYGIGRAFGATASA